MDENGSYSIAELEQMHREIVEEFPNARWVNQTEFDAVFNAMSPTERYTANRDLRYGYCGTVLPSGEMLILGSEIDGVAESR
jgi:hypothetical protein